METKEDSGSQSSTHSLIAPNKNFLLGMLFGGSLVVIAALWIYASAIAQSAPPK